jgi:hypothetical protein
MYSLWVLCSSAIGTPLRKVFAMNLILHTLYPCFLCSITCGDRNIKNYDDNTYIVAFCIQD